MSRKSTANLRERVSFQMQSGERDSMGGKPKEFAEQFQRRAAFTHLRGGEGVMAGRLAGKHSQVVTVRACSQTTLVDRSWRIVDLSTSQTMDIKDITPSDDRCWIDLLCEVTGLVGG